MKQLYLKCYLCKCQGECALALLDGKARCHYNTFWSIYKWTMRSLLVSLGILVSLAAAILIVKWTYFNIHLIYVWSFGTTAEERYSRILSLVLEAIIILIPILMLLYRLHNNFIYNQKGDYWK